MNSDTWVKVDDIMLSEISQTHEGQTCDSTYSEVPRLVRLREVEDRMAVARGGRRGDGSQGLMGSEFQFAKTKML